MDSPVALCRSIAPFAIDCTVKIGLIAAAALLGMRLVERRSSSRGFLLAVAAFLIGATLVFAPLLAPSTPSFEGAKTSARGGGRGASADPVFGKEALPTAVPGVLGKNGSLFHIRISGDLPDLSFLAALCDEIAHRVSVDATASIGLVWIFGLVLILLHRLTLAALVHERLRRSKACESGRLNEIARRIRGGAGSRTVRIVLSVDASIAFTTGYIRPTIVLPAEAPYWPAGRIESTLLHEYAHVRRLDVAIADLLRCLAALAWMSPLPWLALSRAMGCRERACDADVLRSGIDPKRYAIDLLDSARFAASAGSRRAGSPAGTACLGASGLERRILAILEAPRSSLGGGFGVAVALSVLVFAVWSASLAGSLYSFPRAFLDGSAPRGAGEWIAATDALGRSKDPDPSRGAFSFFPSADRARLDLRIGGRDRSIELDSSNLPTGLPLGARARLRVPFGSLVDVESGKPFFNPGWSLSDDDGIVVRAAAAGSVVAIRVDDAYGLLVEIDHGSGLRTRYAFGRRGSSALSIGAAVRAGEEVGILEPTPYDDMPVLLFCVLVETELGSVVLDPAPFVFSSASNRGTALGTSVINAAIRLNDRDQVRRLIARGVSLNTISRDGTLPLEWVVFTQNLGIARDLVAAGADPEAITWETPHAYISNKGPTIADFARKTGNQRLISVLAGG